jgi:peptidoglycan hydrolase-like protein with peptidoglycan-binding domain
VTAYTLARPIRDNKAAFAALFKGTPYLGDVGDLSHRQGSGDHTAWSSDVFPGKGPMRAGVIWAQDFGHSAAFDLRRFAPWLLTCCAAGRYKEVKYVISRIPGAGLFKGTPVFGLYDRRYNWKRQTSSGHDHHIHISYMPGTENTPSTIITDYHAAIHRSPAPAAAKTLAAPAAGAVPITFDTYLSQKRIGGRVPNARAIRAGQCPQLVLGAGDKGLGGWVSYAESKLGVPRNGYYGPECVAAVKALQKRKGYPVTGALGAREWNSLGQPS